MKRQGGSKKSTWRTRRTGWEDKLGRKRRGKRCFWKLRLISFNWSKAKKSYIQTKTCKDWFYSILITTIILNLALADTTSTEDVFQLLGKEYDECAKSCKDGKECSHSNYCFHFDRYLLITVFSVVWN
jgi:hypothetical protein